MIYFIIGAVLGIVFTWNRVITDVLSALQGRHNATQSPILNALLWIVIYAANGALVIGLPLWLVFGVLFG